LVEADLLQHLAAQRRGFALSNITEDPKLHQRMLSIQQDVMNHLLHPRVLQRLSDSGLYGNDYGPSKMMTDLTDAIFSVEENSQLSSFRQPLQIAYVERLLKILSPKGKNPFDRTARAVAYAQVKRVETWLDAAPQAGLSLEAEATYQYIQFLIESALDQEA
jgi:hypothetical protein